MKLKFFILVTTTICCLSTFVFAAPKTTRTPASESITFKTTSGDIAEIYCNNPGIRSFVNSKLSGSTDTESQISIQTKDSGEIYIVNGSDTISIQPSAGCVVWTGKPRRKPNKWDE